MVAEYNCIREYHKWNATYWCLQNQTDVGDLSHYSDVSEEDWQKQSMERVKVAIKECGVSWEALYGSYQILIYTQPLPL